MAETPEETDAREAKEADETKKAEEAAAAAKEAEDDDLGSFDSKRALATIKRQREAEKKLKADLREAREAQTELAAMKKAQEDADKTAGEKLAEAQEVIKGLEEKITRDAVKADFEKEAKLYGIEDDDLDLAYLAAKEQGFLGTADPKTGEIGKHDFESLEAKYPTLAGEGGGSLPTGDAGVRGQGKVGDIASQFDNLIRTSITR